MFFLLYFLSSVKNWWERIKKIKEVNKKLYVVEGGGSSNFDEILSYFNVSPVRSGFGKVGHESVIIECVVRVVWGGP